MIFDFISLGYILNLVSIIITTIIGIYLMSSEGLMKINKDMGNIEERFTTHWYYIIPYYGVFELIVFIKNLFSYYD